MATWDDGPTPGRLPDPDTPGLIPDDASALEPDRLAWLAEQAEQTKTAEHRRQNETPPPHRPPQRSQPGYLIPLPLRRRQFGLFGPLATLCLLAVGLIGAVAVTLITRPAGGDPTPAALAQVSIARATKPAGGTPPSTVEPQGGTVVGHLMPAAALSGDLSPISSQALRPAVVVLIPTGSGSSSPQVTSVSADVVHEIYQQAREFGLPLWLIADGGPAAGDAARSYLTHLGQTATSGEARWAVDPGGVLFSALAAQGPTLIAVRADGVLLGIRRDLPLDPAALPALEPLFARLTIPNR